MRSPSLSLCLLLFAAGCQSLTAVEPVVVDPAPVSSPARRLWEQGQEAMRLGQPDKAIACYKQSLELDPQFAQAHLSLAAAHLELGNDANACPHLGHYVDARPEQVAVRGHYAELLYRLKRTREARDQFDRFIVDAQEQGGPAAKNLLHCHSRLMEIAEKEDDAYAEHLNRGIGLLLLARARVSLSDQAKDLTQESLLCKAAGELTLALDERSDEARPRWYLYEVWSALAQRQLATRWLHEARSAAPFSYLTPAERYSLQLAEAGCQVQSTKR
jgi:tetratricopeptide (TPR) repeat protein